VLAVELDGQRDEAGKSGFHVSTFLLEINALILGFLSIAYSPPGFKTSFKIELKKQPG
jgi:hypothetical protein